jgi:hypothetical protein
MSVDKTLEEVRRIKEECSLRFLSQTPDERRRENEEVMARIEAMLGKPLGRRDTFMHSETPTEELSGELVSV